MRNAFVKSLEKNAEKNKNIILFTGDLGFTVFENFKERFPKQFVNMGVAEANMMGAAAGLALCGKIPFVYSIAPFVTLRPLEQIRNDVCMHRSNVKIIGVGAGLAYSHAGPTHHVNEDVGILRTIPGLVIISPSDPYEVKFAVDWSARHKGPVYIRLGKKGESLIHTNNVKIDITKAQLIKKGKTVLLLSHGSVIKNVIESAKILDQRGISTAVFSIPMIKPIDAKFLIKSLSIYRAIFTIEEHNVIGGLGSCVSEIIAEQDIKVTFRRIGISDQFCHIIGDHSYMKNKYGLSPDKITNQVMKIVKKEKI